MWTEKYRPTKFSSFVGNGESIFSLQNWLNDNSTSKKPAILLTGPPGVGKTTAARMVTESNGFSIIEMNASDFRTKAKLEKFFKDIRGNKVIGKRVCIIMEEIDGMSVGDRGGGPVIAQIIKESGCPIVCTSNDASQKKLGTILPLCLKIDFKRIDPEQMVPRLKKVCKKEGVEAEEEALSALARHAGGDLRSALVRLEVLASDKKLTAGEVYRSYSHMQLDRDESVFNSAKMMFDNKRPLMDRLDDAFDEPFLEVLVFANYASEGTSVDATARASDFLSTGDRIETRLKSTQDWSLAPYSNFCRIVAPAAVVNPPKYIEFPKKKEETKVNLPFDELEVYRQYAISAMDEPERTADAVKVFQARGMGFDEFEKVFGKKIPARRATQIKKVFNGPPKKKRKRN